MNGLKYVKKRCFSSKTSTWVSHETKIVANRGTSLIRLSHGERATPRMISPNHQPILNDAGRAMDNDFHQDKKKNKVGNKKIR
ncbi:hypothetical protein N7449_011998 [Penicillium cf. viridicatum]|uniref:Uncharacterized protein n=1 Tax=Penicillium cf. viridicatum TaxID=2972119 RepID=A0A9W9IQZ2_9EURO|nr:hypothetical protein N7449_011998 [Penicillium cf. viridicatum]